MQGIFTICRAVRKPFVGTLFVASAVASGAQQPMDPDRLARYGGEFAINCADALLPRLRVTSDALIVEQSGRRTTGTPHEVSISYYGQPPPPGFLAATYVPTKRGNTGLTAVLHTYARGRYAKIDGEDKIRDALGRTFADGVYRDGDAERAARRG